MRKILFIGALVIGYLGWKAKQAADQLQFSFSGFSFDRSGSSLAEAKFKTNLVIQNPGNGLVEVRGGAGSLIYNNQVVGYWQINQPFKISPFSRQTVELQVQLQNLLLATSIYRAVINKSGLTVTYRGVIRTALGNVPFTENLQLA